MQHKNECSHNENCGHCGNNKYGRHQLITAGVAVATGFLLGWLLKGSK